MNADSTKPPFVRVLRAGRWGLSIGEGRYYGWRGFLHFGPFIILAIPVMGVTNG